MPKAKNPYPEIDDIREDLDSLKSNVVELTKHIKSDGHQQTEELKNAALSRLITLKSSGEKRVKDLEAHVKQKPAKSVAIAFAAGLATSLLLNRR
ncbi:MAG: hypothetical protein NZ828_10905 [Alphaproteobacteria bacterium]|nr:hypothetical protein [Alphaproteobacteria bacterium]